ncbi:MAG: transglutaminase-like domain-containing protein [Clostridiales bacterium]|nr:transglutaminase-like domain-containing protein [Clostridiales bacterium]
MKRFFARSFMFFCLSILFCLSPNNAYGVEIDIANTQKGVVSIKYTGDLSKAVMVLVESNGSKYTYSIKKSGVSSNVPLQLGDGQYKITVVQNVMDTKYKPLATQIVDVKSVDTFAMYSTSSLQVEYDSGMKAIKDYTALTAGKNANEAANAIYEDLVKNYNYDFDKVKTLPSNYTPVIDDVYANKMGICYDYAVMLCGALRSKGIPTKLVMGYAPEIKEYHAWNEIYLNEKWVVVDTTYDSQMEKAKASYSFAKDGSKRSVLKVY